MQMTQGRTRKEALQMVADWMETLVNRDGFKAEVHPRGRNEFEISGSDAAAMTALLLRRRREATGASLRDVASRLGATSRNAYARMNAETPYLPLINWTSFSKPHHQVKIS